MCFCVHSLVERAAKVPTSCDTGLGMTVWREGERNGKIVMMRLSNEHVSNQSALCAVRGEGGEIWDQRWIDILFNLCIIIYFAFSANVSLCDVTPTVLTFCNESTSAYIIINDNKS